MRLFITVALTTLIAAFCLPPPQAQSGWGGGRCLPVGRPAYVPQYQNVQRCEWTTDGDQAFLWIGIKQIGTLADGEFYPVAANRTTLGPAQAIPSWAPEPPELLVVVKKKKSDDDSMAIVLNTKCDCGNPKCPCSSGPPCVDGCLPTGVISSELGKHGEQYKIKGREVSKSQAHSALAGPNLPDEVGKLRFTVIGEKADRDKVLNDLKNSPALASLAGRLVVQDYDPNHYEVIRSNFVNTGKPTIYLQTPDPTSEVLLRIDVYEGPEALAEAIRKADPNYDPKKDSDGKPKPPDASPVVGSSVQLWHLLAGAAGLLFFALLSRKDK